MLYLDMDTPVCPCHATPMYWHKEKRRKIGGYWRCREARKPLDAARWHGYYFERMPSGVRIPRQLYTRRWEALKRRRERQLRSV